MRILWVKAGGLVPPDVGGKIRSYNILRELATRHSVTFFTFYAEHAGDIHHELKEVFDRAICIPLKIPVPRSRGEWLHFARYLLSPLPYSVAKHTQPEVRRAMHQLLSAEKFDVVITDFVFAAAAIPEQLRCPRILFTHNVEALIWKRHLENAKSLLWKAVCWREYVKMKAFEAACLRHADHVLTVSTADLDVFSAVIPRAKMTVIPTGVDISFYEPGHTAERPNSLVFTGAMDWLPNEDAMLYFIREILPLIQRHIPDVQLTIVGREPSARVLAQAGRNVRVTGRVEDIRPYVHEASLYIVPIRVGSGTRLKIFEAMAMGKAVVSTSVGAEGLPIRDREHAVFADTPHQFAADVVSLLQDPHHRARLGNAAHKLVEQSYSWASVTNVLESVLVSLVSKAAIRPTQLCRET